MTHDKPLWLSVFVSATFFQFILTEFFCFWKKTRRKTQGVKDTNLYRICFFLKKKRLCFILIN